MKSLKKGYLYLINHIKEMTIYGQQPEVDRPKHPTSSWANWKNWMFVVFDKTIPNPTPEDPDHMGKEVEFKLPKEFVVIAEKWAVNGFLEKQGKVWSNEVDNCSKDIISVTNGSSTLYKWTWNGMKNELKAIGLNLTKNVHYVDPKDPDTLRTFCIKWAGRNEWINKFSGDTRNVPGNNLMTLEEVKKWKKWANSHTYPSFGAVRPLTDEERILQQKWGAKLVNFENALKNAEPEEDEEEIVSKYDDDNLPF